MRRLGNVALGAAALVALLAASGQAAAQGAAHEFAGAPANNTEARVDGEAAPEGAVVSAWNEAWEVIATGVIAGGAWSIAVDPAEAQVVYFTVGDPPSTPAGPFEVDPGALSEVSLDLQSPLGEFRGAGELIVPRIDHTATLLPDGRVLILGGRSAVDAATAVRAAEVYDPASDRFLPAGSLNRARFFHSATLLADGTVLVVGGIGVGGDPIGSVEIFDPGSGASADLRDRAPRALHTATVLDDGRVLIAAGVTTDFDPLASAELFDPDSAGFSAAGDLAAGRSFHTATRLADGSVLIAGGAFGGLATETAERFDPDTGRFRPAGDLNSARTTHAAVAGAGGALLIGGIQFGSGDPGEPLAIEAATSERFDPDAGTFLALGDLRFPRGRPTAVRLPDGRVLIAGGARDFLPDIREPVRPAELVDPVTGAGTADAMLATPRLGGTATLLNDGSVVLIGGTSVSFGIEPVAQAERYALRPPAPTPTQVFELGRGFNLGGWLGATPIREATASIEGAFDSIFLWDAVQEVFRTFRSQGPAFVNDLDELRFGDAFWILVSDANGATWEQPSFREARDVAVPAGLSLVLWTGPDETPVAEAFAGIADALISASPWDAAAQAFLTFRPGAPAFVNTAEVLRYGQGVWMQMSAAATWAQPASSE